MNPANISRRRFAKATAAVAAAPLFIPASALGKDGNTAPSERIVVGSVGWGMMGPANTNSLMNEDDCQVVAVCDIDDQARAAAKAAVNGKYKNEDCAEYIDYRDMFARDDIDAVMIALPDHWHGVASVAAAEAGKDIYGEKPLAHTFAEQQAIVAAVNANGRIWQTGSWQRSTFNFLDAIDVVRNGTLGKISRVEVGLPAGHHDFAGSGSPADNGFSHAPPHIRYETWCGPSPYQPYSKARHHKNWRWSYHFGGGQLMDWIGHHNDIGHWGMDWDHTGPVEVNAVQVDMPPQHAIWNTATKYRIECKYADGVETVLAGGHSDIHSGTRWIGENGWVQVDRGHISSSNPEWTKKGFEAGPFRIVPDEDRKKNHWRNFLDCVKSRQKTRAPAEVAHRSATPGHLGLVSMLTGRKIQFDPISEKIVGDAGATALLHANLRDPYTLDSAFGG